LRMLRAVVRQRWRAGCDRVRRAALAPPRDRGTEPCIAYRRFKRLLRDTDPGGREWTSNDTDPSIALGNGAVIRFKTAEKPDNLYGEDVHAAVVDEASRCKEEA